ncbi:hypothetical protein TeGR_g6868 [Tetraparma gracilis]|uniref:Citrate transporter-like domain-containing protein n=1 Tax=Tetraparma gracilis TaxID=2962635 RepID=A0ABQ6N8Y6_9STRA|nr:hypothetical protein TeGR_g6868 [Tetraparma gracilis]
MPQLLPLCILLLSTAAVWSFSLSPAAFRAARPPPPPRTTAPVSSLGRLFADSAAAGDIIPVSDSQTGVTPQGFGFSTSASRILSKFSTDNAGFVRCYADEGVPAVVARMFANDETLLFGSSANSVALVFSRDESLAGIFTERDYVQWSSERDKISERVASGSAALPDVIAFATEKDPAAGGGGTVGDHCTPFGRVKFVTELDTAATIVNRMKESNIRHMLVSRSSQLPSSSKDVAGVISMSKVMSVVVSDERLSLEALRAKYPSLATQSPSVAYREEQRERANELSKKPGIGRQDVVRSATAVAILAIVATFVTKSGWLHDHAQLGMVGIFVLGYLGIIFEELFEFNKAAVALLMSTALWVTYADFTSAAGVASEEVLGQLKGQLAEVSDICFFLLAASTIVEVVDAHQGFKIITNAIKPSSKKQLFWIIGGLTFFLSSILNNLTVTIVMVSLLRKIIPNEEDRKLFGAMVVVAANAGGVWTPIGDVTTTMLWISHYMSTVPTVTQLFLPSVVCLVGSLAFLQGKIVEDPGGMQDLAALAEQEGGTGEAAPRGKLVFAAGIASLLSVPVFSELTGLPPYLAMLTGLGAMWTLTDAIHMGEGGDYEREGLKVPAALSKLDTSGILFFLGILMSIGALDQAGLLAQLAVFLNENLPQTEIIATVIGIASALIDNVPLVAATMGMYNVDDYAMDDNFWQLIALCAGTGGSILVIGSASGVALMGLEKVDFLWYAKNVSVGAAVGYFAGIATYLAQSAVLSGGIGALAKTGGGGLGGLASLAQTVGDIAQQAIVF